MLLSKRCVRRWTNWETYLRAKRPDLPVEWESVRTAMLDEYAPTSTVAAQYSVPFSIALALRHGGIGPRELTAANLVNEGILDLARRVKLSVDPEIDRLFPARTVARITIDTAQGTFTTTVKYPKGNPENPLSDAELWEKFAWLASDVVGQERTAELKGMVGRLDELDDLGRFTAMLAS